MSDEGPDTPRAEADDTARQVPPPVPEVPGDGVSPDELVMERPPEAALAASPRSPLALVGTFAAGFGMGAADVVPGFSGGTVALVVGIYERLIANIRQGARVLSLLLRGHGAASWRALSAIEWPFVTTLLAGILTAVFVLATTLQHLLETQPVAMQATFLGLVLGAALIASREFRTSASWHAAVVVLAAALTFLGLGLRPATIADPGPVLLFVAGAIAICAMILPGVSGAFLLLVVGVYPTVVAAVSTRDLPTLFVFGLGCVAGLASFSTLLNWLLRRWHDLVLAALIGLMVGSVRVLWPWPAAEGVGSPALGPPEGGAEVFLAAALALAAFGIVWMVGLAATAASRHLAARRDPAS